MPITDELDEWLHTKTIIDARPHKEENVLKKSLEFVMSRTVANQVVHIHGIYDTGAPVTTFDDVHRCALLHGAPS
jgi:hypothetical protein